MEKRRTNTLDLCQCRRIWQRVAPELDPYPEQPDPHAASEPPSDLPQLVDAELAERCAYLTFARRAPNAAARRCLQQLALEEGCHARRLAALYFLLSGQCLRPAPAVRPDGTAPWRALLRECWQRECWSAGRYAQLARDCGDAGLRQLLEELSRDEERHARLLLRLLEQNILAF